MIMKKIFLGLIGLIGLMGLTCCDKIADDERTISTGGTSNWGSGEMHRVFVEKYTGPKCTNCPMADETLEAAHQQYGDKLVVISVNHPVGQGVPFPNQPDLRTEGGTAWDEYLGINEIPAAYINRDRTKKYSGSMNNIIGDIAAALEGEPAIAIDLSVTRDGNNLTISAGVRMLQTVEGGLTLTLALTEDSIEYKQSMPNGDIVNDYKHNHMLRDLITNTWGDDIPMSGNAGEHKVGSFTYTIADPTIVIENCHIVAFVSRKDDRTVLNCAQYNID